MVSTIIPNQNKCDRSHSGSIRNLRKFYYFMRKAVMEELYCDRPYLCIKKVTLLA
jgi:hypothetical protein